MRQPTRLRAGPVLPLDVLTPDLVLPFFPQPFESLSWKPGGNFKCQLVKKNKKQTHLNVKLSFEMYIVHWKHVSLGHMKEISFKPPDCHQSDFCGFGASYRQPQVCRGCLVGILMRQLTEVSTQRPQVQPKLTCTTPAESQEETCLRLPPDFHHRHFPSKCPKSLRFTFAVILFFIPTPTQS